MIKIKDMSETHRQSWVTLIVDVAVFAVFLQATTTGLSIDTLSAAGLSSLVLGLIIITIVMHIAIQSVFAMRSLGADRRIKDEWDIRIERKGATYGFYVLSIFLAIIIGHIVIQNGLDSIPEITDKHQTFFDYTNTSHLVFALISASFLGDIVKNASMILSYRGS